MGTALTISETLAEFLMTTRADGLPERTVDLAAMIIASTVASAALGRNIAPARIIRDLEIERAGRPQASVWFEPGLKLPVVGAARANALMGDAAASDDSDLRNIVHCGTPHPEWRAVVALEDGHAAQIRDPFLDLGVGKSGISATFSAISSALSASAPKMRGALDRIRRRCVLVAERRYAAPRGVWARI